MKKKRIIPLVGKLGNQEAKYNFEGSLGGIPMRSTPIGLVLMDDERPSAYEPNKELNMQTVRRWAEVIKQELVNVDGTAPEIVVGSDTITDVRIAQRVGEELSRAGCKQVSCANVWNFPSWHGASSTPLAEH